MPHDQSSLEADFPRLHGLRGQEYEFTSDPTTDYNCIAWAANDIHNWWWPNPNPAIDFWPQGIPRSETIGSFVAAFQQLGYEPCADGSYETGYEKVAIYESNGRPKHMARQLETGEWTSKLGKSDDITHSSLGAIEGQIYGVATFFLRRPRSTI